MFLDGGKMFIKRIIEFAKQDLEADILVSDGQFSLLCYAFPVKEVSIGQHISALLSYGCSEVVKSDIQVLSIKKLQSYYAYSLTALVHSRKKNIVRLGDLYMELDRALPKDIFEGDFVSFSVIRFDVSFS